MNDLCYKQGFCNLRPLDLFRNKQSSLMQMLSKDFNCNRATTANEFFRIFRNSLNEFLVSFQLRAKRLSITRLRRSTGIDNGCWARRFILDYLGNRKLLRVFRNFISLEGKIHEVPHIRHIQTLAIFKHATCFKLC